MRWNLKIEDMISLKFEITYDFKTIDQLDWTSVLNIDEERLIFTDFFQKD